MAHPATNPTIEHASCVARDGKAVLIRGASGSGKSTLALGLMAFGARLVSDDRVVLNVTEDGIEATAPRPLAGLIEARGIGLLRAKSTLRAIVACVVDMDTVETRRLPPTQKTVLLGQSVTLLNRVDGPQFAPAIFQFLASGRQDPI